MPPLTRNNGERELEVMIAHPARTAHAVATGQQGGFSGQIPGTSSDPTQVAIQYSTLQPLDTGDSVAGVGHAVLANDGTPAVMMGNLAVSGDSGYPPEGFQDGGFAFTDASGNAVAGYSHPTGLWGFGSEGTIGIASFYSTWGMGFVYSGPAAQPTWGTTIALDQPDTTFNHPVGGGSICQTGYIGDGDDHVLGAPYNIQYKSEIDALFSEYVTEYRVNTRAVVSAYALDGSSYAMFYCGSPYTSPLDSWSVYSSSGSLFSTDGTNIIIAEDYMIALNFALLVFVSLD